MSKEFISSSAQNVASSSVVIVLDDDEQPAVIDLVGQAPAGDRKCINYSCQSGINLINPPNFCLSYYRVKNDTSKKQMICMECFHLAVQTFDILCQSLTDDDGDIMEVDIPVRDETVAIDDSDSDGEGKEPDVLIDDETMKMLEENFDDVLNNALKTVKYEQKVEKAIDTLKKKYEANNDSYTELKTMIDSIRKEVDSMLFGLYKTMKPTNEILPELIIEEKTLRVYENVSKKSDGCQTEVRIQTRSKSIAATSNADMKPDVTEHTPLEPPADLPIRTILEKPPLIIGNHYYVKKNSNLSSWIKVTLDKILGPNNGTQVFQVVRETSGSGLTQRRTVNGKEIAYSEKSNVMLDVGKRVIALFKEFGDLKSSKRDAYYPGVVGEFPTQHNKYRYLIFFDDGYAHYVHYNNVFLVYHQNDSVWEDVNTDSMAFIRKYVTEYPNRSMVKLQKNQVFRTEFRSRWYMTTVLNIDCSLAQIYFESLKRVEWIYRGSRRFNIMYKELQATDSRLQNRQRHHRSAYIQANSGKTPYVQYTRDDDVICVDDTAKTEIRSVAKKSTRPPCTIDPKPILPEAKDITLKPENRPPGKIVYYTPKRQNPSMKIYKLHQCNESCQQEMITSLSRLKGYGPLAKPLLCGFYRLHNKVKGRKPSVVYKTPCGRVVRNMPELHNYLQEIKSDLTVDLFSFDYYVRCLAEFILEPNSPVIKDLSTGFEDIPIPVVNYVDNELNNFVNYSTTRMPMEGVNLNLDTDFLVGCDCEDDCSDKSKCSCWQLTLQGTKYLNKTKTSIGYNYRRLNEPVFTGIYECNSMCKCSKTCLNRVVQNPLQHKLQVFKTVNRGWGIRCINDIPQGSFICIYAGALLTEQMANEGGKNYGDEYLAELDYIESVEGFKEDYEHEAYTSDKDSEDEEGSRNETAKQRNHDEDFTPAMEDSDDSLESLNLWTRLRRAAAQYKNDPAPAPKKVASTSKMDVDETVTISDDEDVREPSSFNPAETVESKVEYKSVREMFGSDECVYIMDAKNTGNIGRYLNHSCTPNIFVQNVFVDTHDVRFPWVSFFAINYIRAGTELTWNYNYDIGSVPGKVMYCRCGSSECKGRLL
ncbi:PREDICTED: histone-lysine N-methyltransferase eggless isoform X1 [Nicrophorus vespilloides]|uniref:Histone-lysine N-methyltransferase eggless isoform X1 n=2 Tax=Nicrophorus vespilloides TaxID=110193 RepID=A0ABM1N576_NICVS|nr:PREDICTED: histone-lysine N-methyltransferase eggless isoform X1 [Nicrophorus vespilloides]